VQGAALLALLRLEAAQPGSVRAVLLAVSTAAPESHGHQHRC